MSGQNLTAFEQAVVAGLAYKASLASALLDVWADLPIDSVQSVRSLIDDAQLGVTEERATSELLQRAVDLGLLEAVPTGFQPHPNTHKLFRRLAFALKAIDYYVCKVHRDATIAQVVLTRPPRPSTLQMHLDALGWRTADLEPTDRAFQGMIRLAQRRVVVMTPFFDARGATWLKALLSCAVSGVDRVLILRSLEDSSRKDYPVGFDVITSWLMEEKVKVFNYSIAKFNGARETFHAKVVLADRNIAYLGSSNMTASSLEHSMEMGVVLQGRAAAAVAEAVDAVLMSATQWL